MVNSILISLAAMTGATLAVHLGLTDAIGKVINKIMTCNRCATFWMTLAVLVSIDEHPFIAAFLAIVGSYASNWFALLLVKLQRVYNEIWQRINREPKK